MKKCFLAGCLLFSIMSCGESSSTEEQRLDKKIITVKGSDTVFPIIEEEINFIKEKHNHISISISGGGSSDGINALIDGATDIAMASRDLKSKEVTILNEKGVKFKKEIIAYDALMVVVNKPHLLLLFNKVK